MDEILDRASIDCCSHQFCCECILTWVFDQLDEKNVCPLCKRQIRQIKSGDKVIKVPDLNEIEAEKLELLQRLDDL